ncbi:hypothetical protein [Desulfoferula mesophila]|uniref:Uncharacterized protein n=1 Tax=Desulfoferula mesophila TaxID=3058419 RepID=A0AAU9EI85_9BACT|nr:hypothetical protein FAK_00650 [Desulfoferula mesophilus]
MPKTTNMIARELARLSSDCSFLLTHLIRKSDDKNNGNPKNVLRSILGLNNNPSNPILKASLVGWYAAAANANIYNPLTGKFDGKHNSSAVCFTESTLPGLKAHRDIFESQYGLAFDRDLLFQRGANPCLNIRNSILKESIDLPGGRFSKSVFNFIPSQLHPFINIINESFDATHEREWRHVGDMPFKYEDVLFVFCPVKDFSTFSLVQSAGRPVLFDLAWLDRV